MTTCSTAWNCLAYRSKAFDMRLLERRRSELGVTVLSSGFRATLPAKSWNLDDRPTPNGNRSDRRFRCRRHGPLELVRQTPGAARRFEDRQIALIALLETDEVALKDQTSLVEAVESGWWYSAVQSDGRLGIAFMTDPDLHELRQHRAAGRLVASPFAHSPYSRPDPAAWLPVASNLPVWWRQQVEDLMRSLAKVGSRQAMRP